MKRKLLPGVPMHQIDAYASFSHAVMNHYHKVVHTRQRLPRNLPYRMVRAKADQIEAKLLSKGAKVTWIHINGREHSGAWVHG